MNIDNATKTLPITAVIPEVASALNLAHRAILCAAPGAGKSTGLPHLLLNEAFLDNKVIIMLEPRRLAARMVARRLAANLQEEVGRTVGFVVRGENCQSQHTRLLVVTEGVLLRMLQSDPELSNVGLLIFDEFHERNINSDLSLSLALDVTQTLRPDLRILIMSATIDADKIAEVLGANTPIINCPGRMFNVQERYGDAFVSARDVVSVMTRTILDALQSESGSVLAFFPGAPEIERTCEALRSKVPNSVLLAPLYGAMNASSQDLAIKIAPDGVRKVVLATNIAESSLTIDGIRIVVDCGYEKRQEYDAGRGLSTLVCRRISQSSAIQRAGRAGRIEEGIVFRAYSKLEFEHFRRFDTPEILSLELSDLVLELAQWGASAQQLKWLDSPPESMVLAAEKKLKTLGVLDDDLKLTTIGRYAVKIPLPVRLGAMLYHAKCRELTPLACEIAAILEEGKSFAETDLEILIEQQRRRPHETTARLIKQLCSLTQCKYIAQSVSDAASLVALAFPAFVARKRASGGWVTVGGGGGQLSPHDDLERADYLAIARMEGRGDNSRIQIAAAYSEEQLRADFGSQIVNCQVADFDGVRFEAFQLEVLGSIELRKRKINNFDSSIGTDALINFIRKNGMKILKFNDKTMHLIEKVRFANRNDSDLYPDWSDEQLTASLEDWLSPHLSQVKTMSALINLDFCSILKTYFGYNNVKQLDLDYPDCYETPCGSSLKIDYSQNTPTLSVPVGEMYGVQEQPAVGRKKQPLRIELLNPARRPVQTTMNLPHFWLTNWVFVQKELKSQYPKHYWPDHPEQEKPMRRSTKKSRNL